MFDKQINEIRKEIIKGITRYIVIHKTESLNEAMQNIDQSFENHSDAWEWRKQEILENGDEDYLIMRVEIEL